MTIRRDIHLPKIDIYYQYIQESSRIGWDIAPGSRGTADQPPNAATGTEHAEAFGWIDVRDGTLGPRITTTGSPPVPVGNVPADPGEDGNLRFPIGVPQRFDLYVQQTPPCAISMRATYNPVSTLAPDSGRAYLRYPDPQPALALNGWAGTVATPGAGVSSTQFASWLQGDPTPHQATVGRSWFRIVREASGSVFTVTCGAGGTHGFRFYSDMTSAEKLTFSNDPSYFQSLRNAELLLWYRIEWSPATTVIDMNFLREHEEHSFRVGTPTHYGADADNGYSGQQMAPNMGGTIQWIQRLRFEPPVW